MDDFVLCCFYTILSTFYPLDTKHVLYPATESASLFIYFLSEVFLVLMHDAYD